MTNGNEFSFLKLIQQNEPIYSQSYPFALNRQDDIYVVLQIFETKSLNLLFSFFVLEMTMKRIVI